MVVRIMMFILTLIVFGLCALMMYGDLRTNRRKIDKSKRKQDNNQGNKEYLKIYK